jgi:hypothetical protein
MPNIRHGNNPAIAGTDNVTRSPGSTRRCATCQRFAALAPGDNECASCAGRLPLTIPTPARKRGEH